MRAGRKFDLILSNELGAFGRHQILQFFLLGLAGVFGASCALTYAFTARPVPHRCLIEECGDHDETSQFAPSWLNDAIPSNSEGAPSSCSKYEQVNFSLPLSDRCHFDNSSTRHCNEWVYKGSERTIMTEFTLTCPENKWKLTLVGTINSFGCLIGLPLSGLLSDRFGRKTALMVTILGGSLFGIARAFSPIYELFLMFEFLEALVLSGSYSIVFILAMELVSPKHREFCAAVIVWAYALGMVWLGFVAWAVREWNRILLVIYTPATLFISYIWLVPESVRWLMSRGRLGDAKCLIRRAAATNRIHLSATVQAEIDTWHNGATGDTGSLCDVKTTEEPTMQALKQLCRSRSLLWRAINCSFCWITNTLVYYGLSLNSVDLAGTDDTYLNFILVSLVEAPAYVVAWLSMIYIGRRRTVCVTLLLSGVACLLNPFVNSATSWVQLPLYLFGKLTITAAFDTLYVFTAEIFPTRLRSTMMCACSMVGRIGSMLAPQTPLLSNIFPAFPMVLFGTVSLVAGLLALLFPETMGKTLPDSLEDAEALGRSVPKPAVRRNIHIQK